MSINKHFFLVKVPSINKTRFKIFLILFGVILFMSPTVITYAGTADEALQRLMSGNERFATGKSQHPDNFEARRKELLDKQAPFATILACSDSRVPVELLFDQGLGDLFVIRVAGNTVDDFVYASLEFATTALKTPLIMVLGHERCGAVNAALSNGTPDSYLGTLVKTIRGAIQGHTCPPKNPLSCAIKENVTAVVDKISKADPVLAPLIKNGQVKIVGAVYELESGKVILQPAKK